MNLLETLICLALVSLLAGVSVFGYQDLVTRTRLKADVQIISTALQYARDRATRLVPATASCRALDCKVHTLEGEKIFPLSGLHLVHTQLFPAQANGVFTFTQGGMTDFHNGTIEVSVEEKPEYVKKVVVSQGGRISVR
jgi:type II secretory pathway pseudopilin PulG